MTDSGNITGSRSGSSGTLFINDVAVTNDLIRSISKEIKAKYGLEIPENNAGGSLPYDFVSPKLMNAIATYLDTSE